MVFLLSVRQRNSPLIARSLNIFKAADEAVFAKAWGKPSRFFQWAPQRVEPFKRERGGEDTKS